MAIRFVSFFTNGNNEICDDQRLPCASFYRGSYRRSLLGKRNPEESGADRHARSEANRKDTFHELLISSRSVRVDASLISAASGLLGAAIGGLTAFATNWTVQQAQLRAKAIEVDVQKRERLFNQFIEEASRMYGDAMTHETTDITCMIQLYAIIGSLRLVCTRAVIVAAEQVMDSIIKTYLAPNRTLEELAGVTDRIQIDVLLHFGEACRAELAALPGQGR